MSRCRLDGVEDASTPSRSPARPSLVGTSQHPSRQPQESYNARIRVHKKKTRVFQGNFCARPTPSAKSRDYDRAVVKVSSYESYTASSSYESGDESSAGAAWAAGAAGAGAAAGAGMAYAAGGHSAELDYTGPELAHSAELDYNGSHEMV